MSRGDSTRLEPEHLPVAHEIEVVEIPSNGEVGDEVEPPAVSRELGMVWQNLLNYRTHMHLSLSNDH